MPSRWLAALVLASVSLSCSGGNTASQLANAPAFDPTAVPLAEAKQETPTCPGTSDVEARTPNAGDGILNMNTIPPSAVSIDGTPLGCTPKFGFPVSPGAHVVMFVAPDGQKKTLSVTVRAGETKVVAAKLGP